jgi:small ligand-binding sensory domain FIST
MNTTALEKKIASRLACSDVATSADVMELIGETEQAIVAADKVVEAEQAKALDLVKSPDANKARAAMEEVAFARDRLRAALLWP